ncbi:uncharacterized protein N7482_006743 [Penicillium canariense]|uniref:N-acetyltransferase domain-containing protein n=1 Tax=Penicillium canariense TaxID=189055 RepID=A0A9W9LJF8_9EURO|nr:uncharacterized protein N7482_006743 [Penicillium canariense]KAJ5159739.1 hypothetical protein N7482_006743 [Penicillium canariense]
MATSTSKLQHKSWTKGPYLISTDPSLIPVQTLNAWFATEEVYWAHPMPEEAMREALLNSLCFGMYFNPSAQLTHTASDSLDPEFIGIARCITDFTTFIYLTDVFILPSYQGSGLGTWLMSCVQEIIEGMQYLRRSLLFTGDWKRSVPFYKKTMDMHVMHSKPPTEGKDAEGLAVMVRLGKGAPSYQRNLKIL